MVAAAATAGLVGALVRAVAIAARVRRASPCATAALEFARGGRVVGGDGCSHRLLGLVGEVHIVGLDDELVKWLGRVWLELRRDFVVQVTEEHILQEGVAELEILTENVANVSQNVRWALGVRRTREEAADALLLGFAVDAKDLGLDVGPHALVKRLGGDDSEVSGHFLVELGDQLSAFRFFISDAGEGERSLNAHVPGIGCVLPERGLFCVPVSVTLW